jgi:heterodisulfide reductase subunit B
MKYSFFKGCFIPVRFPHIEKLATQILPQLDIQLNEIDGFTCCPEPIGVTINHRLTGLIISARNISLAEEQGLDIITLCNGCTYTLKQANMELKRDAELREEVNETLAETGHQYKGTIKVKHFAQVLTEEVGLDKIKNKVEYPLSNLRIASHTGCHILSPPEVMRFDDPEDPVKLDGMIEALGGTSLFYLHKTQCCGWTVANYGDRDHSNKLLGDKLRAMRDVEADGINVVCPQCLAQLDTGQMLASRSLGFDFKLPTLFYLQYLAIAMGYSLEEIGYKYHRVKNPEFESKVKEVQR